MRIDARHALGRTGEELAAQHFERLGFDVLARRHRTRYGELDLIVADDDLVVFVEVKTRRAGGGHPWEALDETKRGQVRRMGAAWLAEAEHPYYEGLRFDAVAVIIDRSDQLVSLEHMEGAF
jgi:putative endonuclease